MTDFLYASLTLKTNSPLKWRSLEKIVIIDSSQILQSIESRFHIYPLWQRSSKAHIISSNLRITFGVMKENRPAFAGDARMQTQKRTPAALWQPTKIPNACKPENGLIRETFYWFPHPLLWLEWWEYKKAVDNGGGGTISSIHLGRHPPTCSLWHLINNAAFRTENFNLCRRALSARRATFCLHDDGHIDFHPPLCWSPHAALSTLLCVRAPCLLFVCAGECFSLQQKRTQMKRRRLIFSGLFAKGNGWLDFMASRFTASDGVGAKCDCKSCLPASQPIFRAHSQGQHVLPRESLNGKHICKASQCSPFMHILFSRFLNWLLNA